MKNIEHIKNFITSNNLKGLAEFLYKENLTFCNGSNEMCEDKYRTKDACKNCQIKEIQEWLEDISCEECKELLSDEYWRKEFDKFDFFLDDDLFPTKDDGDQEIWEQAGTGFFIVFFKNGTWEITMENAENDYRMPMSDELINLIQKRCNTIKSLYKGD